MDQRKLMINDDVLSNFNKFEQDIDKLNDILQKTYKVMLELDENVWKTREKEVIDQTFMPYLKKFTSFYPDYLKIRLQFAKDAVQSHHELDDDNAALKDIL